MPETLTLHAIRDELFDDGDPPPEPNELLAGYETLAEPELDLTECANKRINKHGNLVLMTYFRFY